MKLLNKFRFTGKDYLDHAIGALILFSALSCFLIFIGISNPQWGITIALGLTILGGGIGLEIYQRESGKGNAQTSDYAAVFVSAVFAYITTWQILVWINVIPKGTWDFIDKWYHFAGVYLFLIFVCWLFIYKQLKNKQNEMDNRPY